MATFKSYLSGFILSLFFTILAFAMVMSKLLEGNALVGVLLLLAVVQAAIQLIFFLDFKPSDRWNFAIFFSTIGIILILVVGSLWIMHHLNYNMMPMEMEQHLLEEEGMRH